MATGSLTAIMVTLCNTGITSSLLRQRVACTKLRVGERVLWWRNLLRGKLLHGLFWCVSCEL